MYTLALAPASQLPAVLRAAGVAPYTSPPLSVDRPDPGLALALARLAAEPSLLYITLHGIPGQPYLYGDDLAAAIHLGAFRGLDFHRTVIFAASCRLDETPFLEVFRAGRPRFLVAGKGENYTRPRTLVGANRLGFYFRQGLEVGLSPRFALALAKQRLRSHVSRLKAARPNKRLDEDIAAAQDALSFAAV